MTPLTTEYTLRMLGDNVTLMRCAWLELLDELRPDSELAGRIRAMLARLQPEEVTAMSQDTSIVARDATAIMGEARGHLNDAPRLVINHAAHRDRTYIEFYNTASYLDFVGDAAMSLDTESMINLTTRLLNVMSTNDRTQAIARAVSTYYTPRVEISA